MAILKQRFREDTAGTLVAYPPIDATPSAASVTILYPDGLTELQAATAMTIGAVSTTVSAATRGARSLTVASATGIVAGRRYLVTSAGRSFQAEVRSISSSTIYLVGKLPFDVAATSPLKELAATYALTTTHTATRDTNYIAKIAWTIASAAHYSVETFDVVSVAGWYPTTISDLFARYPRAALLLEEKDLDGYETLRTAWEQMLVPSLRSRGLKIDRVRDTHQLIPLHVAFVNEMLAEHAAMVDADRMPQFELAQKRRMEAEAAITSDVDWYDADDDLAVGGGEERRNFRGFRLTR